MEPLSEFWVNREIHFETKSLHQILRDFEVYQNTEEFGEYG